MFRFKQTLLQVQHGIALLTLAGLALVVAGCNSDNGMTTVTAHTPAQIAQTSADNYDNNVNGLITGATLKSWKDDWVTNRPAGITGKLVILQLTAGPAGAEYIKANGLNVFTYLTPTSDWIQTRSNGVITTQSMVIDGPTVDALLKKYNIDPLHDMIVCAQGTGGYGNVMGEGRCWYTLRYWGVEAAHLAVLNGGNDWLATSSMTAADFQAAPSSDPTYPGTVSVRDLPADNTELQATVQDMLAILPSTDTNVLNDGVFIWDARGANQYSAGEDDGTGTGTPVADYMTTFQNSGSGQGHPDGALDLNFSNLLIPAEGYRYKDKVDLQAYLDGNVDSNGQGFIDSTYQNVGAGNAYQPGDTIYTYCETTFRAMITGIAATVVLGKPTRFYDGAMVEWHSLSHQQDASGNYILPADSPWRTDVVSFFRPADAISKVASRTINDPYAQSANAIVDADRAYKRGTSTSSSASGSSSGGSLVPSNPCGG